eukprot:CAMPEP_0204651570 /NCGR_PEP_ID=MMETSP0718-20130828/13550_1 /ASSEMBLY_ACC=CAM_ASM_000674 /TAXON_ID=230516 /ORGANISM="Chaetoceros curvisetus" /LENGTH=50 /DNA_ID=CAMNT_0051675347 /DNA_START=137 /DNA_END=285 /DNA_ORIENTATION=-
MDTKCLTCYPHIFGGYGIWTIIIPVTVLVEVMDATKTVETGSGSDGKCPP